MSDGNNGGTGLTPMRALIEDLMKSTSCQTCQRALNMIHILIDSRDCETARSKAVIAASEEARRAERAAVVRECAHTAYVACAETRHGILGDRCHAAICRIATDADNAALDKLLREARMEGMERAALAVTERADQEDEFATIHEKRGNGYKAVKAARVVTTLRGVAAHIRILAALEAQQ